MRKPGALILTTLCTLGLLAGCGTTPTTSDANGTGKTPDITIDQTTPEKAYESYLKLLGAGRMNDSFKLLYRENGSSTEPIDESLFDQTTNRISNIQVGQVHWNDDKISGQVEATYDVADKTGYTGELSFKQQNGAYYLFDSPYRIGSYTAPIGLDTDCSGRFLLPGTTKLKCTTDNGMTLTATANIGTGQKLEKEYTDQQLTATNEQLTDKVGKHIAELLRTRVKAECQKKGEWSAAACGNTDSRISIAKDPVVNGYKVYGNQLYVSAYATLHTTFITDHGDREEDATYGTPDKPAWFSYSEVAGNYQNVVHEIQTDGQGNMKADRDVKDPMYLLPDD